MLLFDLINMFNYIFPKHTAAHDNQHVRGTINSSVVPIYRLLIEKPIIGPFFNYRILSLSAYLV